MNGISLEPKIGKLVSLDKAGRIVVPKPIREALQLRVGEPLKIEQRDDEIVIRRDDAVHLEQIDGLWVICGGPKIDQTDVNDLITEMREQRMREIGGW